VAGQRGRSFLLPITLADVSEESGGGVRERLSHLAGSLSNRVLEELDPDALVERLDVDGLVARIDVDGLVARIDVDALVSRADVDALLVRVDVNGLIDRVDVDRLLQRVDVNAVLDRVEVDPLLERADVDAVLDRVDVHRLLDRVDLDKVVARLDMGALVGRVDLDALVARLDLDGILQRVDLDALVARIDVDGLVTRVDVDALVRRADVDALLAQVDINGLIDRIDVDRLLQRVDVNALLDRVDLDEVAAGLDIDALVERVDLERMLEAVDLEGLVRRAGIPELVADSTGQVAGSALDLGRRQLVGLDVGVGRVIQRLLRRDPDALPAGPPTLVTDDRARIEPPDPGDARAKARFEVSGFYAGSVSRLAAFAGDVALSTSAFTATAAALSWVLATLFGIELSTVDRAGPLWALAFIVWLFAYWWVSAALAGRTPIMALAGLRIVSRDGSPLRPGPALVRTIVLPVSLLFFGLGGLWILVDPERRALHDLLARSAVVYDWGGRPAEMPTPLANWIAEHGQGT
jgi:uncharacterized RDD family membrane protein YckC